MATFSVNNGQPIEASKKENIFSVLLDLPDNTKKLISPKDIRDAFFTTWASNPFKVTTANLSPTEYIGIDSSNPANRDIKKTIFLGKRAYGNLDIMSDNLLSSGDTDIFFYNTKLDSADQSSTKISILSGTDSALWPYAPYIQSYTTASKTDLNLVNPSPLGGAINITSLTGRVAINGVVFPTLSETINSASNGKVLRYYGTFPNGYLQWDEPTITLTNVGSPLYPTNIYGDPINVNGYPIEFVEDDLVPAQIGGIPQGFSFSADSFSNSVTGFYTDWPLVEVIRKLIYPRVEPVLSLSINNPQTGNTYAEVGTTASFVLTAGITLYARNEDEYISDFVITGTTYSVSSPTRNPLGFSFSGEPGATLSLTASAATFSSSIGEIDYNFRVSDTWISGFGGVVATPGYETGPYFLNGLTASVSFIAPFLTYVGYLDNSSLLNSATNLWTSATTSRLIINHPGASNSIKQNIKGTGYLYFGYPSIYNTNFGTISQIKDPNGFIIHDIQSITYSAFTYSYSVSSSGTTYTNYTILRTNYFFNYTGNGEFEFIF